MNEITTRPTPSLLLDPTRFEAAQRAGKMIAISALFPAHLRTGSEQTAVANAVLVMNIADRMREDPLAVAQNIYFVGGKPGWNASYMISRANQSGVFKGPIRWRIEGEGDGLVATAYAKMADDGQEVDAPASMAMAKAEGWTKNPKYASMPRQMLQYRSATFLIRLYCPEVMLGYQTVEEIEDVTAAGKMVDVTPPVAPEKPADEAGPGAPPEKKTAPREKEKAKSAPEKPAEAPKPDPAAEDAEVVDEATDASPEAAGAPPLPDHLQTVYDRVLDDLKEAKSAKTVQGIFDLFTDQIDAIREVSADAYADIEAGMSAAFERVKG